MRRFSNNVTVSVLISRTVRQLRRDIQLHVCFLPVQFPATAIACVAIIHYNVVPNAVLLREKPLSCRHFAVVVSAKTYDESLRLCSPQVAMGSHSRMDCA